MQGRVAAGLQEAAVTVADNVTATIQSGLLASTMDTARSASKIFTHTLEQHLCAVTSVHSDAAATMGTAFLRGVLSQYLSPELADQRRASFEAAFAQGVATRVTAGVTEIHSAVAQAFTMCLKRAADFPAVDPRSVTKFIAGNFKETLQAVAAKYVSTSPATAAPSSATSACNLFLDQLEEDLTRTLERESRTLMNHDHDHKPFQ
jgi:hypothetical protein